MTTLVLDCGERIVGILHVENDLFRIYTLGEDMDQALDLIRVADEVVTYNGTFHDLKVLGKFAGLDGELPIQGAHADMQRIRWDPILGSNLVGTYDELFPHRPTPPPPQQTIPVHLDGYQRNNLRDVMMTFELWKLWKQGKLPTCS